MSSSQSAIKWLLIGGAVFGALVLVCAGLAVWLIPKAVTSIGESIGDFVEEQEQQAAFAAEWEAPPEDAAPESLFPDAVSGFTLGDHDNQAQVAEFAIDLDGLHGNYKSSDGEIEVFAYRASHAEMKAVFDGVSKVIEERDFALRSHFHRSMGNYARYDYSVSPPSQKGVFWWASDWLFFFRTTDEADIDSFIQPYLTAIQPEETEAPESAESPPGADAQ